MPIQPITCRRRQRVRVACIVKNRDLDAVNSNVAYRRSICVQAVYKFEAADDGHIGQAIKLRSTSQKGPNKSASNLRASTVQIALQTVLVHTWSTAARSTVRTTHTVYGAAAATSTSFTHLVLSLHVHNFVGTEAPPEQQKPKTVQWLSTVSTQVRQQHTHKQCTMQHKHTRCSQYRCATVQAVHTAVIVAHGYQAHAFPYETRMQQRGASYMQYHHADTALYNKCEHGLGQCTQFQ